MTISYCNKLLVDTRLYKRTLVLQHDLSTYKYNKSSHTLILLFFGSDVSKDTFRFKRNLSEQSFHNKKEIRE